MKCVLVNQVATCSAEPIRSGITFGCNNCPAIRVSVLCEMSVYDLGLLMPHHLLQTVGICSIGLYVLSLHLLAGSACRKYDSSTTCATSFKAYMSPLSVSKLLSHANVASEYSNLILVPR
jgi:hypothetical protein